MSNERSSQVTSVACHKCHLTDVHTAAEYPVARRKLLTLAAFGEHRKFGIYPNCLGAYDMVLEIFLSAISGDFYQLVATD